MTEPIIHVYVHACGAIKQCVISIDREIPVMGTFYDACTIGYNA